MGVRRPQLGREPCGEPAQPSLVQRGGLGEQRTVLGSEPAALGLELHHHHLGLRREEGVPVPRPRGCDQHRVAALERRGVPVELALPPAAKHHGDAGGGVVVRLEAEPGGEPGPGHDQPTRLQRDRSPVVRERAGGGAGEGHRVLSHVRTAAETIAAQFRSVPAECIPSKRAGDGTG